MKLYNETRRKKQETLERAYPGAVFIDITSKGVEPWVQLSPFYPHGDFPVPFSPDLTAYSVEGVWQGLKVFEQADIDVSKFNVRSMSGLKRSVRRFGAVKGHRAGPHAEHLLGYLEARRTIYLPTYRFLLEKKATAVVERIASLAEKQPVVLLDFETNGNVEDLSKPLSHAALVVHHLSGNWPSESP